MNISQNTTETMSVPEALYEINKLYKPFKRIVAKCENQKFNFEFHNIVERLHEIQQQTNNVTELTKAIQCKLDCGIEETESTTQYMATLSLVFSIISIMLALTKQDGIAWLIVPLLAIVIILLLIIYFIRRSRDRKNTFYKTVKNVLAQEAERN